MCALSAPPPHRRHAPSETRRAACSAATTSAGRWRSSTSCSSRRPLTGERRECMCMPSTATRVSNRSCPAHRGTQRRTTHCNAACSTQHTHTPSHAPPPRLPSAHHRVQASQPAVQLAEPPDGGVWHRCDLVPSGRWRAYTAVVPNRRRHRPRGRLLQPAALSAHGAHERTVAHAAPAERPLRDAL